MNNASGSREFVEIGTYAKPPGGFIKPAGLIPPQQTVQQSEDGLAQMEIPSVTASERSFLDRHAN
jgi:hypothetical protein